MAEYESIHGTRVKYLSSDPTLDSSTEGQVWYNSTTGANKVLSQIKAWSSGGNMGTARYTIGSCGSQTAALGFGGYSGAYKADTEEYNGFSWSTGGNLNLARFNPGGAGSQTAALAFGGFIGGPPPSPTNATEEYDGSSWTAQNTMPTAVRNPAGSGTQTAGLSSGGNAGPPGVTGVTQEYDGTNWTTSPGSMNVARENATGFGIQTATIVAGGNEPGVNNAEQYNGSTWTAVSNLNSPVYSLASAANGTTSHGITFGGASPAGTGLSQTEEWDGSTWTISPASLAAGKWKLGGAGTASAGLKFAGGPPPSGNVATEEYNSRLEAITTTAAWASGGVYPGPVYSAGSSTNSPSTASVAFGGFVSTSKSSATNEYNGSSWTSANAMSDVFVGGAYGGTQTAAFGAGGYAAPPSRTAATEQYDGTNWTAGGNLSVAASQNVGFGTSTAGVVYGGEGSPEPAIKTSTQEYDGSSWTTVNTMPVGAAGCGTGFGTQTAGVRSGGTAPTPNPSTWDGGPGSFSNITLLYDGTNWTAGAFSNFGGRNSTGFGVQTSGVTAGGEGSPGVPGLARTEQYDGTSWTDVATVPRTSTSYMAGFGASSGSGAIVGGVHTVVNSTDEYTGQVIANQASTLTTS